MIRIPDIPDLAPDNGFRLPKADPTAATAPGRALGVLGESIAGLGSEFHKVAFQAQEAKNADTVLNTQIAWDTDSQAHFQKLATSPNADSYIPETRKLLDAQKRTIADPNLPPAVQQQLKLSYDRYAHSTLMQAGDLAVKVTAERAGQALTNSYQRRLQQGDRQGYSEDIDSASTAFRLTPEKKEAMMSGFDNDLTTNTLYAHAQDSPREIAQDLEEKDADGNFAKYPNLSINERQSLLGQAHSAEQGKRREEIEQFSTMAENGKLKVENIDGLGDYLTPADRDNLKKLATRATPYSLADANEAQTQIAELQNAYDDYSLSDLEYAKKWNDAKVGSLVSGGTTLAGQINKNLSAIDPETRARKRAGAKVAEDPFDMAMKEGSVRINSLYRQGSLGAIKDVTPGEVDRAIRRKFDLLGGYQDFVNDYKGDPKDLKAATRQWLDEKASDGTVINQTIPLIRSVLKAPDSRLPATGPIFPPQDGLPSGRGGTDSSLLQDKLNQRLDAR